MGFFDFNDPNPTMRFYVNSQSGDFAKDDEEREWVDLRLLPDEETRRIWKEVGVKERAAFETSKETGLMQRVTWAESTPDQRDRFNDLVWDYSIAAWNLFDRSGNSVDCTTENKLFLMRKSPVFVEFFEAGLKKLRENAKRFGEDVAKN